MSTGEPHELHGIDAAHEVHLVPGFLEKYGKQMTFGVIALVILFAVVSYIANNGRSGAEKSWSKFAAAQTAADFANVASDFPGSEVAVWARLTEGEMLLREAVQLQFSDRAAANGEFKKADEALESVLASAGLPVTARERALLGKARLLEATSEGNTDEAIAAYEKVKEIPNSIYAKLVDSRIEALKKDDIKSFYAWFSKQTPKPEDRARPQDGLPTGHPELPVTLPPIPEELFPADWSDLKLNDAPPFEIPAAKEDAESNKPAAGDAAPNEPAGDAATPAKPAADAAADKTPAAEKTSADDAAAKNASASELSPRE